MAVLADWEHAKLVWSYDAADADEFHIKWGFSPGDYSAGSLTVTGNSGQIDLSDLLPDTGIYYIAGYPSNSAGEGTVSNELNLEAIYLIWLRKGR